MRGRHEMISCLHSHILLHSHSVPHQDLEYSAVESNHWHGVCGTRRHLKTFQPSPGTKSADPFQMHPWTMHQNSTTASSSVGMGLGPGPVQAWVNMSDWFMWRVAQPDPCLWASWLNCLPWLVSTCSLVRNILHNTGHRMSRGSASGAGVTDHYSVQKREGADFATGNRQTVML